MVVKPNCFLALTLKILLAMKNKHQPDLSFIDNFISETNLEETKDILSDFLLCYFESQEENGTFTNEHTQKILFNFKIVSAFFDKLRELQIKRYGIN